MFAEQAGQRNRGILPELAIFRLWGHGGAKGCGVGWGRIHPAAFRPLYSRLRICRSAWEAFSQADARKRGGSHDWLPHRGHPPSETVSVLNIRALICWTRQAAAKTSQGTPLREIPVSHYCFDQPDVPLLLCHPAPQPKLTTAA